MVPDQPKGDNVVSAIMIAPDTSSAGYALRGVFMPMADFQKKEYRRFLHIPEMPADGERTGKKRNLSTR
jgi:hypothetical protein